MEPLKPFAKHYDAIVVGARCAGAATAMLLARRGARVLLIDWAGPGTDTMSTHALMRGAVMQLGRWGVLDRIIASGTPAIQQTTFHYGTNAIKLPIKPSNGVDALYAPRRTVLDSALVEAAREAGVDVRFGVSFRDVVRNESGRVTGAVLGSPVSDRHQVDADLIVGADGRRSTVARRVNARTEKLSDHATSCVYAYFDGIRDTGNHWYYVPRAGAGLIPTNAGQHCVFVSVPRNQFVAEIRRTRTASHIAALAAAVDPELGDTIASGQLRSQPVGFVGQKGHLKKSWGRGWALVGDAGYFKDPVTAHGITDALRDAEILARAVIDAGPGSLAGYQYDRDALSADLFAVTDEIAGLEWTLPKLQALHMQLNETMKREQQWMDGAFADPQIAA